MRNYAPTLPRDSGEEPMQEFPAPKLSLARYDGENASSSSVISVTHNTTALEVAAVGGPAAIKWITTGDTSPSVYTSSTIAGGSGFAINFDHVIGTGTVRRFVIPIESNPQTGSVQGINREIGLYQRVAIKSIGIASVLTSEF